MEDPVALPTEGVDRNLFAIKMPPVGSRSPSPRRAWIEIMLGRGAGKDGVVALPTEGVDRNWIWCASWGLFLQVALPTEGVDRNVFFGMVTIVTDGRPPHGGRG